MPDPRRAHPMVFLVLILPFGAMSGYLTVAVAYLLSKAGVGVEQIAELVAVSFIPQTWKFLWAPIADITWSRKRCAVSSASPARIACTTPSCSRNDVGMRSRTRSCKRR